jgi:hypothetical protein
MGRQDKTFRLAFQNVNSLGSSNYSHSIQEFAETQLRLQIDLAGLTEHCLNVSQPKVLNTIQKSLNRHHRGQYAIQMNSADLTTTSPYLPGGTASLLLGDHLTRIDASGRGGDPLGRWSYFTLRRKQLPPLTIYTVYKVNKLPTNSVGITAWHQQRLRLDEQNRQNKHPRDAFTTDLIKAVLQHQAQRHQIIVGGDFNVTLNTPRSQLLRLANILQLIDPWTIFYPQYEDFNTYQRGSARIDSLLISHDLLVDSIRKIGYSPYNWITISEPHEVEYYLLLRNRSHFGQAHGTPFTRAPFDDYIPWTADSTYCNDILAGTIQTSLDDVPQCTALLQACKAASDLDILPATISEEEFRGKILSWKETTSTSPSGRHLGIYKSLFAPGPYHNNPEDDEETRNYYCLRNSQLDIRNLTLEIINYCIHTGYILERWKTIVNTMIFKDTGVYKIHRLRVIHIYEADFNLLLAVKWRQLLQSTDQRNLINPGLFGGYLLRLGLIFWQTNWLQIS